MPTESTPQKSKRVLIALIAVIVALLIALVALVFFILGQGSGRTTEALAPASGISLGSQSTLRHLNT